MNRWSLITVQSRDVNPYSKQIAPCIIRLECRAENEKPVRLSMRAVHVWANVPVQMCRDRNRRRKRGQALSNGRDRLLDPFTHPSGDLTGRSIRHWKNRCENRSKFTTPWLIPRQATKFRTASFLACSHPELSATGSARQIPEIPARPSRNEIRHFQETYSSS